MIVYVESNFVLELALLQEEHGACEDILQLADSGAIRLLMPAFSLGEPYETLVRRHAERRALAMKVQAELRQLGRTEGYAEKLGKADTLIELLSSSGQEEATRLNQVLTRLLNVATILPTERAMMIVAMDAQKTLKLDPQDSLVYAAVLAHAEKETGPKCFLNKNVKDFLIPDIVGPFEDLQCKLLGKFVKGVSYINATLATPAPAPGPAPPSEPE